MATRSNAGRGFTTGRGVKTHQQVFEEHVSGDTRDSKQQVRFDRDQSGQRTAMNLRESRIPNRIKSIALTDRRTKKSGRGYTRQDWISHHRKIVERVDQYSEKSPGNEKTAKLTEVLRARKNNSDQQEDRTNDPTDHTVDTGVEATDKVTDDELMEEINDCMSRLEKLPNDRKVVKLAGPYTDTTVLRSDELSVLAEVHVKSSADRLAEITTHHKPSSTLKTSDRVGETSLQQATQDEPTGTTGMDKQELHTPPHGDMDIEVLSINESNPDQLSDLMTQADARNAITTVAIKQEMLDEEAQCGKYVHEQTDDTDNSSGSESIDTDGDSSDTYMYDSESSESHREEEISHTVDQTPNITATTVKRKSITYDSNKKQKKLHLTSQKTNGSTIHRQKESKLYQVGSTQNETERSEDDPLPVDSSTDEMNNKEAHKSNEDDSNSKHQSSNMDEQKKQKLIAGNHRHKY